MPQALREGFLEVNPDPAALQAMFDKDVSRMRAFRGWSDAQMASIAHPALVISGNRDVGSLEHAVRMAKLLPKGTLAVFPGGHGTYLGSIESLRDGRMPRFNAIELIREFLDED
jgi:pimeloyl-ACP methyl ester carboxylesterase